MDVETVRKYAGKKVYLVLRNNFEYTTILPNEIDNSFTIIDKFGDSVDIECEYISFIREIK